MALFFFLLFVSGFISEKEVWCVCFLRLIRGLLLWGIQFLFFLFLRISHRELLLLVQGLPQIPRNRSGGYPLLVSQFHCLNLCLNLFIVGLRIPLPLLTSRDIYINSSPEESGSSRMSMSCLDSRIHSRLDLPWNFLNLQKHWWRGKKR